MSRHHFALTPGTVDSQASSSVTLQDTIQTSAAPRRPLRECGGGGGGLVLNGVRI